MRMRVSANDAVALIRRIPHAGCQKAARRNWVEGGEAGVTAQSICWLFCWAKTGMGSEAAARQAQQAFDTIFDGSYHWFDSKVPHEWARRARYARGDIEDDLGRYLEP